MKIKPKLFSMSIAMISLAAILSFNPKGSNANKVNQEPKYVSQIHLGKDSVRQVKKGENFVKVCYPAEKDTFLEVNYMDFDNDSDVDVYTATFLVSNKDGASGKTLALLFNKQLKKEGKERMSDELQEKVNQEYKLLRDDKPINSIHLSELNSKTFGEKKDKIGIDYPAIIRVTHPPKDFPYLEIEYYSENNSEVTSYTITIISFEGEKIITEIPRKTMTEEMKKEIDNEYRILAKQ